MRKKLRAIQLTVFFVLKDVIWIRPNVYRVHKVRKQRMDHGIKQKHRRPIDERWNWLHFLEFSTLFIEWHRHIEQNVEEHRHRHEHRVHVKVSFADFRLISVDEMEHFGEVRLEFRDEKNIKENNKK